MNMDEDRYNRMKTIILSLASWLNCPNDELENMIGVSWYAFNTLRIELEKEA